jgi:predicted PurR-regulated permease PerM
MADWFEENAAIFDLNLPALFPPVGTLVWQLVSALIIVMVVIATGLYLAMTPISLLNAFLRLFSKDKRTRVNKMLRDLYEGLHTWPIATILSMAAVGTIMSFSYWLIGLPSALLLGIAAGLLEVIPYFGAVIAAIPAVITAATVSPTLVFLTLLTVILVQTINRNIIIPSIMSKVVKVHPAVVAVSVIPIYWVFGLLGVFLVVPICVVFKILIRDLWIERSGRRKKETLDQQSASARR